MIQEKNMQLDFFSVVELTFANSNLKPLKLSMALITRNYNLSQSQFYYSFSTIILFIHKILVNFGN
jgi:hypothetical protein